MTVDYDKFWDEIIEEAQEMSRPLQENEITARLFAEKTGRSFNVAKKYLDDLVSSGKLSSRQAILNGHKNTIYFPNSH